MVNILLTEDNPDYRKLIKIHLLRAGYQVFEANDGEDALGIMEHEYIHLLIADIMMPLMDGLELTRQIRSAHYDMPILIISAKNSIDDKRSGFHSGADDYMTKPFEMDELIFRIEALLRRSNLSKGNIMQVNECQLNSDTLQFHYNETAIELRQKEFFLLQKLLSYPGKIFTRQNLMDEIWGPDSETDPRTVDVHIKRLREKLSDVPSFEIQTIRGLGYRAVVPNQTDPGKTDVLGESI